MENELFLKSKILAKRINETLKDFSQENNNLETEDICFAVLSALGFVETAFIALTAKDAEKILIHQHKKSLELCKIIQKKGKGQDAS